MRRLTASIIEEAKKRRMVIAAVLLITATALGFTTGTLAVGDPSDSAPDSGCVSASTDYGNELACYGAPDDPHTSHQQASDYLEDRGADFRFHAATGCDPAKLVVWRRGGFGPDFGYIAVEGTQPDVDDSGRWVPFVPDHVDDECSYVLFAWTNPDRVLSGDSVSDHIYYLNEFAQGGPPEDLEVREGFEWVKLIQTDTFYRLPGA